MKLVKSIPILLILAVSFLQAGIVHADLVLIHGHVLDDAGSPVEGVYVKVFSLTPPWQFYGQTTTDVEGHYSFSLERGERVDFPRFYKGRPVFEGYQLIAGAPADGRWRVMEYNPGDIINTENTNEIKHDFKLKRIGLMILNAYAPDGSFLVTFPPEGGPKPGQDRTWPVYVTDLNWQVLRTRFLPEERMLLVGLNQSNVINFPWDVPGFGRVILRADNDGRGFVFTRPGDEAEINLNYELARTEFRLLKNGYEGYLHEGYAFSSKVAKDIQSAEASLRQADSAHDAEKARYSDMSLNRTLWTAEGLELEKANQAIERYRKGNVLLQIVDSEGRPASGMKVSAFQTTHDFLFGTQNPHFDPDAFALLRKAGFNYVQLPLNWRETEPSRGQFDFSMNPISEVEHLRDAGIRVGGYWLLILETGGNTWDTGLTTMNFDELRDSVRDHVHTVVTQYSDYVDRWEIADDPNLYGNSLGFAQRILEVNKIGAEAVKGINPRSELIATFGHPCGFITASSYEGSDDEFTTDAYAFFPTLQHIVDTPLSIGLGLWYGSVYEFYPGTTETLVSSQIAEQPFRDLASLSRLLDWYGTLSVPVEISAFNVPSKYSSTLGYWHRRAWDERLQAEWIDRFYRVAFSKPRATVLSYLDSVDESYMTTGRGLLTSSYTPRESYYALERLITEDWTTKLDMDTDANGQVQFRGFAGNYLITVDTDSHSENYTIHVGEQTDQSYVFNLGKAKAEQAIAKADEAVNEARTQGRTISLDKAESLLQNAQKALAMEDYGQAAVLAEQADRAADSAVTWLIIPTIVAFAGALLSTIILLHKRAKRT